MRAFLAVVPPREARDKVEAVREPLRELAPGGRWVHPSLWHVTLKFLGEVEDELVPAIADLVSQVAARYETFDVSLSGTGLFPNAQRPRVLWVGIQDGADILARLAADIESELDGLGFEPDEHGFQSHMTLARFRESHEAGELAGGVGPSEEIARFAVDSVVLMKSVLRPRGPDYSVVEKLPLIPRPEPEPAEGEAADGEAPTDEAVSATPADAVPDEPDVAGDAPVE